MIRFWLIYIIFGICTGCLFLPAECRAVDGIEEIEIPRAIEVGLGHFLDLANPDKTVNFEPEKVAAVMNFINLPGKDGALYYADSILHNPSAYYEFDIHQSFKNLVSYSFNPDIPSIATVPSSARLLHWRDKWNNRQPSPHIGRYLDRLDSPVVIRGLQHLEITPDTHSGAYYAYSTHQTIVLFKHHQRKVLVTVSRQVDVSAVGKKGYVLGADDDWDYFYSGKPGLTIPALGWVKSYMYESSGINIYEESAPLAGKVRCAVFKWLRAGWSGINMVRRSHIFSGLKRFAKPMKEILEYPLLPAVAAMANDFSRIRSLSDNALKSKMKLYAGILQNRYNGDGARGHSKKLPSSLFNGDGHWTRMSRDEMESVLIIEYMKYAVGKTQAGEVGKLLDLNR